MKKVRLSLRHRTTLYVSSGILLLSGGLWLCFDRSSASAWPSNLMKIHGAAAMASLLVLGSLWDHVQKGWASAKNRLSGSFLIGLSAFLIVSGWMLYYVGDERLRVLTSRAHWVLGLVVPLVLLVHILDRLRKR